MTRSYVWPGVASCYGSQLESFFEAEIFGKNWTHDSTTSDLEDDIVASDEAREEPVRRANQRGVGHQDWEGCDPGQDIE